MAEFAVRATVAVALACLGCGDDEAQQGTRDRCAVGAGTLLECQPTAIDTAEQACWRLVECAVIPLEHPDALDWRRCVGRIEGFADYRRRFALTCVEHASCDDLKVPRSPTNPSRSDDSLPSCLQFGDQ